MMYHISMFRVKPEHRNEKSLNEVIELLRRVPEGVRGVASYEIGRRQPPEMPEGRPSDVTFYDIIQRVGFESREACDGYVPSRGHTEFLKASSKYMENVAVLDYEEV